MTQQTDEPNVQTFVATGGSEVDRFFGCWLDINQPFRNVLPLTVPFTNVDGPFDLFAAPVSIEEAILRSPHQCLVAEIAFDPVPIPFGKDPSNWDKLAQRNLAWSDLGSARALSTFEVRPTPAPPSPAEPPDELMIDWNNTPAGTEATLFLPGVSADEVIDLASRMYTTRRFQRGDDHTLLCKAGGITYIPIPHGSQVDYAGLLSLDLPQVRPREVWSVVVRQVTNAFSIVRQPLRGMETAPEPPPEKAQKSAAAVAHPFRWRRVHGAFQLNMPVHADKGLLLKNEERVFAVMQWIAQAIPAQNRSAFEGRYSPRTFPAIRRRA